MEQSKYNHLIIRHLSGELTRNEEAELQSWLSESIENQEYYQQISNLLTMTQPTSKPTLPDIDAEWQKIAKNLELKDKKVGATILPFKKKKTVIPQLGIIKWQRYAVAAAILIVLLSAFIWQKYRTANQYVIVKTQNAEIKQLQLADGSMIKLNSTSRIEYLKSFSDSIRQVSLIGEAFFDVASEKRQFVVLTKNTRISVLGTEFNVWARDDVSRVIVKEGKVAFSPADSHETEGILIKANQMALAQHKQIGHPIDLKDTENLLGWLSGRIVFYKTNLQEVVDELTRRYDIKITLENPNLDNLSVTGSFEKKSIKDVLKAICLALDLQFRLESGNYIIYE